MHLIFFLTEVWTCVPWILAADRGILYRLYNMTVQLVPVTTRHAYQARLGIKKGEWSAHQPINQSNADKFQLLRFTLDTAALPHTSYLHIHEIYCKLFKRSFARTYFCTWHNSFIHRWSFAKSEIGNMRARSAQHVTTRAAHFISAERRRLRDPGSLCLLGADSQLMNGCCNVFHEWVY